MSIVLRITVAPFSYTVIFFFFHIITLGFNLIRVKVYYVFKVLHIMSHITDSLTYFISSKM